MLKKFILIATIFLIVGCGSQPTLSASDALATIVAGTLSAMQVTPPASGITTPDLTMPAPPDGGFMAIPTPEGAVLSAGQIPQGLGLYVYVNVDNLNLRNGPGRLYESINNLARDTQLEILGNSANSRWLLVKDPLGSVGWVDINYVKGGNDNVDAIPNFIPADSYTISGFILNAKGPVTYVGITLFQGELSDESYTDDYGNFYFYVPKSITGDWFLEEYSIDCKSILMDANCRCFLNACGSLFPASSKITFPLTSDRLYMSLGWQ